MPKPNQEKELRSDIQGIFEDFMLAAVGMGPARHSETSGYVSEIIQLIAAQTQQLEQRVMEARPGNPVTADVYRDSVHQMAEDAYANGWNEALDDWSTKLKGVFHE